MHYEALKLVLGQRTDPRLAAPFEVETGRGRRRADPHASPTRPQSNLRAVASNTAAFAKSCDYLDSYQDPSASLTARRRGYARSAFWLLLAPASGAGEACTRIAMRNLIRNGCCNLYWAAISVGRRQPVGMNERLVGNGDEVEYALNDRRAEGDLPATPSGWSGYWSGRRRRRARSWSSRAWTTSAGGASPVLRRGGRHGRRDAGRRRSTSDADACIFYTSGTTGNPRKGAQLTSIAAASTI